MRIKTKERSKPWIAKKQGRNTRNKATGKLIKPFANKNVNSSEFYNSSGWRSTRASVLAKDALCSWCLHLGRVTEATEVDHVIPLSHCSAEGINPLDKNNLVPSCRSCNARRAAYEARGVYFTTFDAWVKYLRQKYIESKNQ